MFSNDENRRMIIRLAAGFLTGTAAGLFLMQLASQTVKKYRRKKGIEERRTDSRIIWTGSLLFGLVSSVYHMFYGFSLSSFCSWLFMGCLFFASLIDAQTRIIPDRVHGAALLIFVLKALVSGTTVKQAGQMVLNGLLLGGAAFLLALIMDKRLHKESLGGGDIKLLFTIGLYLPWVQSLFAVMAASLAALMYIVIMRIIKKEKLMTIPFGPFISFGTVLMMFIGDRLSAWYVSRF